MSRRNLVLGAAALGAGTVGARYRWEEEWLELVRTEVRPEGWRWGPVRIGFLADLHIVDAVDLDRSLRALRMILGEKPDVILLGGDYGTGQNERKVRFLRAFLAELRETGLPAAGVYGNHDVNALARRVTGEAFAWAGVPLPTNGLTDVGGLPVYGFDDALYGEAVATASAPEAAVHLLHEPDYLELTPPRAPLVLSGHTHGGQMCLPGGVPFRLPPGGRRYLRGVYRSGARTLYVTKGIGLTAGNLGPWKVKRRLFCRPEATILDVA